MFFFDAYVTWDGHGGGSENRRLESPSCLIPQPPCSLRHPVSRQVVVFIFYFHSSFELDSLYTQFLSQTCFRILQIALFRSLRLISHGSTV